MSTPGVPPWGCPWHGKVQGGHIALSNGDVLQYPQPAGLIVTPSAIATDRYGSTHRVRVPGIAPISRSPEEEAADADSGREWRNEAILAGANLQLHGRPLGGWIYIDPDGARWLVTCAALNENTLYSFATGFSATLTLSRFGELGGQAETHSYAISSDWGIDGADAPASGRALLDAINASGSAAIVMVHERRLSAAQPQLRWPHSFLEITLSGPGASVVASCSVARSRTQVARCERNLDLGPEYLAGYYTGPPAYTPQWRVQLRSAPTPPGEQPFEQAGGRICRVFSGSVSLDISRILAIWYDSAGNQQDVVCATHWEGDLDFPAPATGGRSNTGSANWTAAIQVSGDVLCELSGAWEASSVETLTGVNTGTFSMDSVINVGDVDYTNHSSGSVDSFYWVRLLWDDAYEYSEESASDALLVPRVAEYGTEFSGHIRVLRYSPQVIGLAADAGPEKKLLPPATPSGPASGAAITTSLVKFYGSHDPYSGAAVWAQLAPVCYV